LEAEVGKQVIKTAAYSSAVIAVMIGLWLTSRHNYLLFHSLGELVSIGVAAAMFSVAWDSRRFSANGYLTFLGIAFLSVACLDLVHTLAYKGLGVFTGYGANLPTQLWIAGRGVESFSLLISPVFLDRRVRPWTTLITCMAVTAAILALIFPLQLFPTCYVEGGPHPGLTPFKIGAEYVICMILLAGMGILWVNRRRFSPHVMAFIICAIGATILSELAFTHYVSVYGDFNMAGHLLKVISFLLFYKAIVQASLKDPYRGLFRELKQQEEALRESEERYRTTMESIGDAVIAVDRSGAVTFMNRVAAELTGWRSEEALRQPLAQVFAIINEKTRKPADNPVERVIRDGHVIALANHTTLISRDGREIPIEDSAAPITSADGKMLGVVMVFHDVTEKRRAETALSESETQYRLLFAENPNPMFVFDEETLRFLAVNDAAVRHYGWPREEFLAMTVLEIRPP
jgi:PAS domain S-box-containing protein